MATTVNLLSYNNALMRRNDSGQIVGVADYVTNWTTDSGLASISVVSDTYLVDTRYSLRINPSTSAPITLTLLVQPLKVFDGNRVLSFNCKLKANSTCDVSTRLQIEGTTQEAPHNQEFSSGQFNAVQSNRVLVPNDGFAKDYSIYITISNHGGSTIYLTNFHLIHDMAFYENPFVPQMRGYMPDFYWEYDSDEEYPTYPFHRLVDVLSSAAGDSRLLYNSFFPFETPEFVTPEDQTGYWAKSTLTSPHLVRDEYIPWLSQFTGVRIQRNAMLPDGTLYFQNPSLERDYVEWQLRTGHYGRNSGTRQAIIEAAQQFLIRTKDGTQSTKSVGVTTNYLGDPFVILVQTLENETIDAGNGESSPTVLTSLNLAKPIGYKILHETVDEFEFTLDSLTLGRLDEFRWG